MLVKTKETFGSLDIVCNNAGIEDETNWEKLLSIKWVLLCTCIRQQIVGCILIQMMVLSTHTTIGMTNVETCCY